MVTIHPKFVIDENEQRQAVQISIEEWQQILDELEELDDIRAYDAAKAAEDETIPFEQALREIDGKS